MRLAILSSLIISGLFAATGCSVSGQAARHSATPAPTHVADTSNDPSWTPPGEMDLAIGDAKTGEATKNEIVEAMPQPNKREVLRNQLHAATY